MRRECMELWMCLHRLQLPRWFSISCPCFILLYEYCINPGIIGGEILEYRLSVFICLVVFE